ncbi:hypothetical protein VKT23_003064 [Stygiomarasmius scandens]|uniref:Uncharacterized protein n=1 Tax=Marasmiellus scandens TaxID=2682957 RepID=A0ABR1K1S7_9AGAR
MPSKITGVLLPLLLFPALSASAFYFILGHTDASGWGKKVRLQCLDSENPYALSYTGVAKVDSTLCLLVSIFHAAFTPVSFPFTLWLLASAVPITSFLYIEAHRRSAPSFPISHPSVIGFFMQTVTFGVTFPIYWLLAILTGATSHRASSHSSTVSKTAAEAIVFGILVGMFVPTASMLSLHDPSVTAIWQFFPLFASFATGAYLFVRPASKSQESGHSIIVFLYAAGFIASSSVHLAIVSSRFHDSDKLKAFFFPSTSPLDISFPDDFHALHLLQWDAIFGFGSCLLGSLWFARSTSQFIGLLIWELIAVPVIGPGAAIAGVALWRENYLHSVEAKSIDAKK